MLVLVAGGCVVGTREPLYDRERDTVVDRGLVGTWQYPDGKLRITRGPGRSYRVGTPDARATTRGAGLTYDLVPLGRRRYLFPRPEGVDLGTVLFQSYQVRRIRGGLCLRVLDVGALAERLRAGGSEGEVLKYETLDVHTGVYAATRPARDAATRPARDERLIQNLVITDSPRRIRQFLIEHKDDATLFGEEVVLRRAPR